MSISRVILCAAIPVLALIGGLMLLLSTGAPAPQFGLYLSIGAWMLVLALGALPYLVYRQWRAPHDDSRSRER